MEASGYIGTADFKKENMYNISPPHGKEKINCTKMPTIVYNLYKDAELRNIMSEIKLPIKDCNNKMLPRNELIYMHKLFTCKFNALCDAGNGITIGQLAMARKECIEASELKKQNKTGQNSIALTNDDLEKWQLKIETREKFRQLINEVKERKTHKSSVKLENKTAKLHTVKLVCSSNSINKLDSSNKNESNNRTEIVDTETHIQENSLDKLHEQPEWRKTYDPVSKMTVYFNENTREAVATVSTETDSFSYEADQVKTLPAISNPVKWACQDCTFLNLEEEQRCVMCMKHRSTKTATMNNVGKRTKNGKQGIGKREKRRRELGTNPFELSKRKN